MTGQVQQSMDASDPSRKRKRPPDSKDDAAPRNRRGVRLDLVREARKIDSQSTKAAFPKVKPDLTSAPNTTASSAVLASHDGEISLEAFIASRQFEIQALEKSIRETKAVKAERAFQLVPRSMRRRTASHNVKRVPKRLRRRAKAEMESDMTPTVEARRRKPRTTKAMLRAQSVKRLEVIMKRKKRRKDKKLEEKATRKEGEAQAADGSVKSGAGQVATTIQSRAPRPKIRRNELNDPQKPKSKFRKRQLNKTWLPTHLWHAKRARMTLPKKPLWRFAIPLTPSEKCYRPTHRASGDRGAVIWDTSYMSHIGVYGSEVGVERLLRSIGANQANLWSQHGAKWRAGQRSWSGMLSKERKEGRRNIGPATILWNGVTVTEEPIAKGTSRAPKIQRQVLLRVHPACFLELFTELRKLVKMQTPRPYIEDLRFEIGSVELIGPASTEALHGTLKSFCLGAKEPDRHGAFFERLTNVANPASLPLNAVLGFSIQDPRLAYPPRREQTTTGLDENASYAALEALATWPIDSEHMPFALFDRDARFRASQLPSMKSINRRKGNKLPGQPLTPIAVDPPIPIILLATRSVTSGPQAQGKWTLLAPWKCIVPLWYSLAHYPLSSGGNPRFGGLNEMQQVAFEQGEPWFPGDFPGTQAGADWEIEQRAVRREQWERRPKGKRVAWESLDLGAGRSGEVGDGTSCDFEMLFGLRAEDPGKPGLAEKEQGQTQPPSDKNNQDVGGSDADRAKESKGTIEQPHALHKIRQLSSEDFRALASPKAKAQAPPNTVVTVRLTFVTRGVCSTPARIYRLPNTEALTVQEQVNVEVPSTEPHPGSEPDTLPSNLRQQWLALLSGGKPAPHNQPRHMPPGANMQRRKALIATSLLSKPLPSSTKVQFPDDAPQSTIQHSKHRPAPAPSTMHDIAGHPLCPNREDLIGFVTTGSFSLSEGKGVAIGSISAEKAVEILRDTKDAKEAKLCIVRNAGENIGRLARWHVV
jgi:ribonuclease P/MRP protein subunit POP1